MDMRKVHSIVAAAAVVTALGQLSGGMLFVQRKTSIVSFSWTSIIVTLVCDVGSFLSFHLPGGNAHCSVSLF